MILTTVLGDPVLSLYQSLLRSNLWFNWSTWHTLPTLLCRGVWYCSVFLKKANIDPFWLTFTSLFDYDNNLISNLFTRSFCRNTNCSCDKGWRALSFYVCRIRINFRGWVKMTSLSYVVIRMICLTSGRERCYDQNRVIMCRSPWSLLPIFIKLQSGIFKDRNFLRLLCHIQLGRKSPVESFTFIKLQSVAGWEYACSVQKAAA